MFYYQTSLKAFSTLSTISLAYLFQPYLWVNDEESSDEEEAAIVIKTDQTKPVRHTVVDQSKLVSCTDKSSSEEEDLHIDVNFEEQIDLTIH